MPYLIAILFVPLLAVLAYAFVLFDRLLRAEYVEHRSAWQTDGKPVGFFWRAPECTYYKSSMARHRLSFVWLFWTPTWMADSPELRAILRRQRLAVLAFNIGVVIWFLAFLCLLPLM